MGIRLSGNVDVAVKGAERGSNSHSIGRIVCKDKQRYHSTSIKNESDTSIDCEGRALWEPCEPRGQQTTMDYVDIRGDGTSNVKVLIDTSYGAPQSFEFGHF